MRKTAAAIALAACMATGGAQAQSSKVATQLGTVLGSEGPCGLAYDQAAIEAYIEAKAAAADLEFTSILNAFASLTATQIEGMTASQKTAHCAQVRRNARSMKILKP